jgi:hypothetical protein
VGRGGRLGPHHQRGVAAVQLVAEAPARGGGVDRGAVEDQADRFGSPRQRASDDLLAFALGFREYPTECLVDVAEDQRERQLDDTDEIGSRFDNLVGAGQLALQRDLLAAPITLIDRVQVDAAARDGAGAVKRLRRDGVRKRGLRLPRDREEAL